MENGEEECLIIFCQEFINICTYSVYRDLQPRLIHTNTCSQPDSPLLHCVNDFTMSLVEKQQNKIERLHHASRTAFKCEHQAEHRGDASGPSPPLSLSGCCCLTGSIVQNALRACVRVCGPVHTSRSRLRSLQEMTQNMTRRFNPMCPASSFPLCCRRDNRPSVKINSILVRMDIFFCD